MSGLDIWKDKTNEELFAEYKKSGDLFVKQELTLRYLYIVKAVAVQTHNLYSDFAQMEDIINEGVIAIMKGIDRYDPEKDNKFETFISRRIRGMVIDQVRKNDWLPRDYHKQNQSIEKAKRELSETLKRPPSDEELAKHLQMNVKKCQKIQRMSTMINVLSLDMLVGETENGPAVQVASGDTASQPEKACLQGEVIQTLTEAIDSLKEKEKLVISLYYVEELNMGQIARVMEVSEPRISQIHSAAIKKLKAYMDKNL